MIATKNGFDPFPLCTPTEYSVIRLRRTALRNTSLVMTLCLVYQMGACPCGCWEHNHWFAMLGLEQDERQAPILPTTVGRVLSSADSHDCTGAPKPLYASQSELKLRKLANAPSTLAWHAPLRLADSASGPGRLRDQRGPPGPIGGPANRARLQVFLL
jgi:hypothetical protein